MLAVSETWYRDRSIPSDQRAIEPQATASRWRALTHNHSRRFLPQRPDAPPGSQPAAFLQLNETNLRGLLAILALSGCTDSRGVHRDPLRSRFGAALARIGERAERIAGAVREGVMSSIFDVTWVNPGSLARRDKEEKWFDWATMENVYAGHGSERSKVLCTVEFGLACVRRAAWTDANGADTRPKTNGSTSNSVNGAVANGSVDGVLTRSVLLKPKVLLESVIDIL